MITFNREELGKSNYLAQTMESFERSGLWKTRIDWEFHIYDGGSEGKEFLRPWANKVTSIDTLNERVAPNVNAGRALWGGSRRGGDFVLFTEDDIEVCADFIDGVAQWLYNCARFYIAKLFTFYTPYVEVEECFKQGQRVWPYPIKSFYGTQCFAIRSHDAESLGDYLINLPYPTKSYDMEIKEWSKQVDPNQSHFLASVPCFVQHKGEESALFEGRYHYCQAYKGEDYSYVRGWKT